MRASYVLLPLLLCIPPAAAQTPGTCEHGAASAELSVSDVRARLANTGALFYGPTFAAAYLVPKSSGISPIYAAGLWIGGKVNDQLRVAAARYDRFEFWPGPLAADGHPVDPDDCSAYDRIWRVSAEDIEAYDATGSASPDLAEWPVALGAPVIDGDGVAGNYDLAAGDRPEVYGHEAAFWVMNDVGNAHLETGSQPIGVEVRVTAFAIRSAEAAVDQATFYRYEVAYVGAGPESAPLEDAYLSVFSETNLGSATDDYAGTDTTRNLGFFYNADNEDDGVYGVAPPAVGYQLFERAGAHMYVINATIPWTSDPGNAEEYYNFMQGRWKTGDPITERGYGYQTDGPVTRFAFAGDPVTGQCWSEVNPAAPQPDGSCAPASAEANDFDQRRQAISTEAFRLETGQTKVLDFAILFARGADHLDSVTALRAASDRVRAAYAEGPLYGPARPVAAESPASTPAASALSVVYPNPASERATAVYTLGRAAPVRLSVYDVLGRRVVQLAEGTMPAGTHRAEVETAAWARGVYLVVLDADGERHTKRLVVR